MKKKCIYIVYEAETGKEILGGVKRKSYNKALPHTAFRNWRMLFKKVRVFSRYVQIRGKRCEICYFFGVPVIPYVVLFCKRRQFIFDKSFFLEVDWKL